MLINNNQKKKAILSWSGGKDSALALHVIRQSGVYEVSHLLTTVNEGVGRISMHGVRTELLERQAERIGLPLIRIALPSSPELAAYEEVMKENLQAVQWRGITAAIFGDLFLEDIRAYREKKLSEIDMEAVFPLWGTPTQKIIRDFLRLGFRAITSCVQDACLHQSFVGRLIDEQFLNDLPATVDPCGENGEYHSFVFDGPIFTSSIRFKKGEIVYRQFPAPKQSAVGKIQRDPHSGLLLSGFWYCDLIQV